MPKKLIKKIVTVEEYVEPDDTEVEDVAGDIDDADDPEDEDQDDEEVEDDDAGKPRKKSRRRR
ncbi:hypothetical protein [Anaeromyxobacter oryzisoli]|uniref:hypothetical protein n=1 Tax=Anaeromyxobacter oryzisoli TaxID=2925408 RepID=UPI001F58D7C5|nr:hypothetical protein [Anaeromyxobacter sp. SG63]